MAVLGCELVGVRDPRAADRKKLIVWVEIDRCMTDAVGAVTGVRLGRRSLKYLDYGKVAATFLNTETGRAVRLVARESSRELAESRYGALPTKKERQMRAYAEAEDGELFKVEFVAVKYNENDQPGHPRRRVICESCGEGVNDAREIHQQGRRLCRPCATEETYYEVIPTASDNSNAIG